MKSAVAHIFVAIREGHFLADAAFRRVFLALYTASFLWIFLIPADFWDDLAVKNNPDIIGMNYQAGLLPDGWLLKFLLALKYRDPIDHGYVFLSYIAITLLVRRFIAEFVPASEREKNAIALLTAVLPLYLSRYQLAAGYYCLSLLLFCIGSVILARTIVHSRPALYRIVAHVCFILAFFTEFFLAFYGFVVLLIVLSVARQTEGPTRLSRLVTATLAVAQRAPEAIILPFAFFILKALLVHTSGPFVGYNEVTPSGLLDALPALPFTTIDALTSIPGIGPTWLTYSVILLLAAAGILMLRPAPIAHSSAAPEKRDGGSALLVAFLGLMFAVFPYAVVYRLPSPFDFADRNQMTMLLVTGAAITFAVKFLVRGRLQWIVIFFVLVWATATDVSTYLAMIVDGHTQNAIVRTLSQSEAVRENKALLVDTTLWPNLARQRDISTGQLNCLMKQAFGDETHFAADWSYHPFDWNKELAGVGRFRETGTCFRAYPGGKPVLLTIKPGPIPLTRHRALKLSLLWLFDSDAYEHALDGFASISVGPVPDGWLSN